MVSVHPPNISAATQQFELDDDEDELLELDELLEDDDDEELELELRELEELDELLDDDELDEKLELEELDIDELDEELEIPFSAIACQIQHSELIELLELDEEGIRNTPRLGV